MLIVAVLDRPIVVPKMLFLSAWNMIDTGAEPPPAFGTNLHYWSTADARGTLEKRALGSLETLGLARNGRLNPMWRGTLTALAQADREYYSFTVFEDGKSCSILIASHDGYALRVVIDDQVVALAPIEDRWHATALVETLPEVPGASVRAVSMPREFYDDPEHDRSDPLAEPVDTRDRDHLAEVLARPRRAVHQLYSARRDNGERVRSSPITVIDLAGEGGRVVTYVSGDGDVVMVPGTGSDLVVTINDTMNGLG
ncbi:ESX secretion-associated protein EspG [Amycolatopsis azurea]|uniref:ESX secretion-associated protein EspG n=1 Tax=Amycolatopsis azurea TaxID=36819 RepID=UPI001FD861C6|nr:ESX secretion-associated protein EspG [Amycolatopsis azurea]